MTRGGPVSLLIVDDHDLFREGVAAILRHDRRIAVVGEGSSAQHAVALTAALDPDVLLLDVELPGGPARATVARIHRGSPRTRIVMLTMHRNSDSRTSFWPPARSSTSRRRRRARTWSRPCCSPARSHRA